MKVVGQLEDYLVGQTSRWPNMSIIIGWSDKSLVTTVTIEK